MTRPMHCVEQLVLFLFILQLRPLQAAIQRLSPITIEEQTSIGTSIYDLNRIYSSNGIRFSFLSDTSAHNVFFMIDSLTGRISIKRLIDREELCQSHVCPCDRCVLTLEMIAASDHIDILSLDVIIADINDHRPMFPVPKFEIRLPETTDIGHIASFPAATDLDYQPRLEYRCLPLVSGKDRDEDVLETFSIVQLQTENQLGLRLMKTLDRERRNLYQMRIQVSDGEHTAQLLLDVLILDSNDHVPEFEQEHYHIRIAEDTPVGTNLLRIHAKDLDEGLNAKINYTIVNPSPSRPFPFTINVSTGVIELMHPLDYEHETNYRFSVRARDNGADAISVYSQIQIDIIDVNDCPPEIEFILPDGHQSQKEIFSIEEEKEIHTRLFHISVSDKDAMNENIHLKLLTYDHLFQLHEQYRDLYSLLIRNRLDREQQEEYRLIFEATDQANGSSLTSQKHITIRLTDINDCPPLLDPYPTPILVSENNPPNVQLMQFHARDLDASNTSNSQLIYSLLPSNDSRFFSIDPQSGILSLGPISFDYESKSSYQLILNITDQGTYPKRLETLQSLTIGIRDLNDNPPVFDQNSYHFHLMENSSIGTWIGEVKAMDRDSNSTIYYQLDADDDERSIFDVDQVTGQLFSKVTVDFESQSIYHFSIIARDDDDLHSTAVNVTVQVIDINDHSPIVETPASVYISSEFLQNNFTQSSSTMMIVTQVMAKDDDQGMNGNLTYEILHGNRHDYFDINRWNGTITANPQRLPQGYHRLIVNVCDQGNVSRHCSIGTINIKVGDHVERWFYSTSPFEQEMAEQKSLPDYKHIFTREIILVIVISSILTVLLLISIGLFCTCFRHQKKQSRDLFFSKSSSNNKLTHPTHHLETFDDLKGGSTGVHSEDSCYGSNELSRSSSNAHAVIRPLLTAQDRSSSMSSTSVDETLAMHRDELLDQTKLEMIDRGQSSGPYLSTFYPSQSHPLKKTIQSLTRRPMTNPHSSTYLTYDSIDTPPLAFDSIPLR